jgi:hypothetical protein
LCTACPVLLARGLHSGLDVSVEPHLRRLMAAWRAVECWGASRHAIGLRERRPPDLASSGYGQPRIRMVPVLWR